MTVSSKVDFRPASFQSVAWYKILTLTLAFWLGASLFLDLVMMPSLYASGMMSQPDFVPAGYGIFWIFNRIELLCAALVVTGVLVQRKMSSSSKQSSVLLSILMLLAALICTYFITPEMGALGVQLDWFESSIAIPNGMNQLHMSYWLLEMIKFVAGGVLLGWTLDPLRVTRRDRSSAT
ncbi:DUF4149 domain-containing protein [Phormidesmis priestleyi]